MFAFASNTNKAEMNLAYRKSQESKHIYLLCKCNLDAEKAVISLTGFFFKKHLEVFIMTPAFPSTLYTLLSNFSLLNQLLPPLKIL